MKQILLLADKQNHIRQWSTILKASVQNSIHSLTFGDYLNAPLDTSDYSMVFVIADSEFNDKKKISTLRIINYLQNYGNSIVINHIAAGLYHSVNTMLRNNIKGIVKEDMSIIQISKIIDSVSAGGIYIDGKSY